MGQAFWKLDREGFVQHYMVSGPLVAPFSSGTGDPNLLRFEASLRETIARHEPLSEEDALAGGRMSRLGLPWRFQGGRDTSLVNLSGFYSTMQRVQFDAATVLESEEEREVPAVLWSYAAVDVYCNGKRIGGLDHPVYKPIQRRQLLLPLRAGKNVIYLACETLGVRDTRSVVGLQIPSGTAESDAAAGTGETEAAVRTCKPEAIAGTVPGIRVTLPDAEMAASAHAAMDFLDGAKLTESGVRFSFPAPKGAAWAATALYEPDHRKAHLPPDWREIGGMTEVTLPDDAAYLLLRAPAGDGMIRRLLERTERIRPQLVRPVPSPEENLRLIMQRIAEVENFDRGEEFGFPICNLLARQYLGCPAEGDEGLLEETLKLIDQRVDCADFLVCGLIRYVRNYPVSDRISARTRQVLTHWRYWMDQDGFDGMCFWSENHCLMFYTAAMLAGEMYPEGDFPLARRTGAQLRDWGRGMVLDWLEDVEKYGFEEFHSTVYMCVTLAALLNVIDFAEPEISFRAAKATDQMLRMLAMHTFRGGIIAPQGRVYRGAIYPFAAGAMALMNLADPAQTWDLGEGWLSFLATSKYRFPKEMPALMAEEASLNYTSGNARILLEKHPDWCLTSVMIPREPFSRWENIARRPDADPSGHAFVKSFNECFHGTTCFQPGGYGYQQHLWYAALDGEAILFVNHPGSTSEGGDLRPGYWHGNGVFPALRQQGNLLGMIWRIPEEHPIHYVHAYCPECRFDECRREGNWLLLRKEKGYIGLWSSRPTEPWDGENQHCEQRIFGSGIACLCVCAGRESPHADSMEAFAGYVRSLRPEWNPAENTLTAEGYTLTWKQGHDDTQYL